MWGSSALKLIVDADQTASIGYPYHVRVGLKNVADVPVYNVSLELLDNGRKNFIYQPQQKLAYSTGELDPGKTLLPPDFILIPEIGGTLDLGQSFVDQTAGAIGLQTEIKSHPDVEPPDKAPTLSATPGLRSVGLQWQPVPGATAYRIFSTTSRQTPSSSPRLS